MILELKDGDVKIELFSDIAPNHVKRIKELADNGKYDNVVFHRVIDGFMAQTGDVEFGNSSNDNFNLRKAGTGNSDLPDLKDFGQFVSLVDNKEDFSLALEKTIKNENKKLKLARMKIAEKFSWESRLNQLNKHINNLY